MFVTKIVKIVWPMNCGLVVKNWILIIGLAFQAENVYLSKENNLSLLFFHTNSLAVFSFIFVEEL